ncbi:tRNA (guanosine(46)-N7)-methyltransferase TrmB [Streptomyces sp. NBC_01190]|uniref:tRNA (guanosine(46)-N7)-methyltransferase TrmB n=1 Tax=Streptomyces sp. NBC_01190 TaxID=2903767 RepID=UPI00386C0673|nr:tRNA (guanosine(46)-N7)-methyltransferase TrmB [Streptomyces sp. NBC_01190]
MSSIPTSAAVKFPAGPAADPAGSRGEHRIRSFHARRGRITQAQAAAIERHWERWGVELDGKPLDLAALFAGSDRGAGGCGTEGRADAAPDPAAERQALASADLRSLPVILEIGFGMGDATAAMAAADPRTGILAVDVHTPGQGNLLALADRAGLTNIRVANGDAVVLLRDMLPPASLAGLRVYFPDPWPKAKHHKRRLIQPAFLALVTPLLRPGAVVHCATDWEPYAEQMLEVLSAAPGLVNQYEGFAPRPGFRPMTKFERQGLAKGHVVRDLLFARA